MLNITQGNPVPLGIQLRRNGADFAPESEGLRVLLTDYYGSRAIEDVSVADGKILATVPTTVRVGKYGIEITGTQAGSPWRTKYNDVLNITDETVEDVSDEPVTMTGDYYDIILTVNLYGGGESADLLEELERLRGEVTSLTGELAEKDEVISQKDAVISQKDAVISEKDSTISGLQGDLQESQQQLSDMTDERDKATLFIGSYLGGGADIEVPGRGELNIRYGTIEVPAGITEIGDNAFRLRDNVINIDLGDAQVISNNAFRESSIQSVRGEDVTLLKESCFRDCANLVDVYLPNANSTLSFGSFFNGCRALTTISLPSLAACGASAFSNCSSLKNVHLPNLITIGNALFQNCSELEEISLPSLIALTPNTFLNCNKLRKVDFTNITGINSPINYGNVEVIILRRNILVGLGNTGYINNTCTVYVPDELVDEYKAASNWKNHAGQIRGLSEYVEG